MSEVHFQHTLNNSVQCVSCLRQKVYMFCYLLAAVIPFTLVARHVFDLKEATVI